MVVDSVLRHWLSLTVEDESDFHGRLGTTVVSSLGVFFVNDGLIGLQEPECFQWDLYLIIRLFRRVALIANIAKYRTMTCKLWVIYTGMS